MVLIPMDTPGVEVVRNISVMNHLAAEGHCEIMFATCACRLESARRGRRRLRAGAGAARARPHPSLHALHRSGELALELMFQRSQERNTFGRYLHEHGPVAEWIALSRCEIEQARLLVLKTAWLIDK